MIQLTIVAVSLLTTTTTAYDPVELGLNMSAPIATLDMLIPKNGGT